MIGNLSSPPKDNIPAAKKDKSWHLQWGQFIMGWHSYNWNGENFPYAKFLELRRYFHGNQDIRKYKPNSNYLRNNNLFNNIAANHRNLKTAFIMLNAVHGKLNKIKVEPTVQQIDSNANDFRREFETKIRRLVELKQAQMQVDEYIAELKIDPLEFPMDDEEVQIFLMNKPVIMEEAEMESAIMGVFESQDIETTREMVRWYLLAYGIAGIRTETINGQQYIRPIDIMNAGTNICKYKDFRDIRFAYEVRPIAPEVIRSQCGDYFSQEDYKTIESVAGNLAANTLIYRAFSQFNTNINSGERYNLVIDFEVVSTNNIDIEFKASEKYGVKTTVSATDRQPTADRPDRALAKMQPQTVYKGKYIVGADLIYDWGPKEQVAREPFPQRSEDIPLSNPAKAQLGFHFVQPSLMQGSFLSMLEAMLPMIDNLQQTYSKITELLARIMTQVISIDLDAIIEISLGKNKKLTPEDIIDIFIQHGIDLYSSSTYKGMANASANKGVQFKDNKSFDSLGALLNAFSTQYNMLENFVGINSVVKGGEQSPEIGKAVTEMVLSGTDNVLEGVLQGEMHLIKSCAKHLMWTAQRYGLQGVYNSKPFKIDPAKHSLNIYNCKMQVLPSPGEWQSLYMDAKAFAQAGEINYEDLVGLKNISNFKMAQSYLAYKRKRKEKLKQMNDARNMETTFKGQQESALVAEQAKAQSEALKSQNKIAEIQALEREKRMTLVVQAALEKGFMPKETKEIFGKELEFISLQQNFYGEPTNNGEPIPAGGAGAEPVGGDILSGPGQEPIDGEAAADGGYGAAAIAEF